MNWTLRYLICYAGVTGAQRLDTLRRTGWDEVHKCQSYLCATKEEWDLLGKQIVAKANRRLYQAVELFCEATGERRVLKGGEIFAFGEGSAGTPARSDAGEAQFTLDCIKATLKSYAGQPATPDVLMECVTRITNAVRGTVEPLPEETFVDRMKAERAQLCERHAKLQDFVIANSAYPKLPKNKRDLLLKQCSAMGEYLAVLNTRLDLEGVTIPGEHAQPYQQQEGSEPSEAHTLGEAGATPAPATISQTPEVGQSGTDAVEASAPTEGTLSTADSGDGDTLEVTDPASTPETATAAESDASPTTNGAGTGSKRVSSATPPAKKTAKAKK